MRTVCTGIYTVGQNSQIFNSPHPCRCLRYKKLSYRRGTARRAVTVKTVLNVAQMFVELHLISPALDLQGHPRSLEMA